jgi:hypothetical protein
MARSSQRPGRTYLWKHSTYITSAWEWFLEFVGRAAEAILVVSVLYSSAKLLPIVHMPASLDVVVFIAQFVALDVGGLSLGKLAKAAADAGNIEGARYAGRMSRALITIMIAGVVVVAVEQLFSIPANWKLGIDTALLVARSILAVLYGHIIHAVKVEEEQADLPPALDIQAQMSWPLVGLAAWLQQEWQTAMAHAQTRVEQRISELVTMQKTALMDLQTGTAQQVNLVDLQVQRLFSEVQELQTLPAITIDYDAVTHHVMTHLKAEFDAWKQAQIDARPDASPPQLDAPKDQNLMRQKRASHPKHDASSKILTIRQPNASSTDKKERIHQLLDKDQGLSSYRLATLVGCSEPTARRIKNEYIDVRHDASNGVDDDASECESDASDRVV